MSSDRHENATPRLSRHVRFVSGLVLAVAAANAAVQTDFNTLVIVVALGIVFGALALTPREELVA